MATPATDKTGGAEAWATDGSSNEMDFEELRNISAIHDLAELQDPGGIERLEQDDGSVRYTSILLLAPGVWGDAGSGRTIYYSPDGIERSADNWDDNTVNLFHERENEVTDVGVVDTESVFLGVDDGGLHGDIVLHMETPASEFADEALQNALETGGREGIQGPSVELRGEEYRFNEARGVHELVEGTFIGLGLVGLGVSPGPGSKDAAFAEQTQGRAVALAGTDDAALLTLQNDDTMDINDQIALLAEHGIQLGDDPDEETVATLFDALELAEDNDDDDDDDGGGGDDTPDDEGEDEDDDEDEDMELSDVADRVDALAGQVEQNAERINAIAEATEQLQESDIDLSELNDSVSTLSEQLDELAASERVDDLESRLSELEDEPEEPSSLMDLGDEQDGEHGDGAVTLMGSADPTRPQINNI